jgi:hypothetical protein
MVDGYKMIPSTIFTLSSTMQILILESELYNCRLRRKSNGEILDIEKIYAEKMLEYGWFIKMLYVSQKNSHGVVFWQNISINDLNIQKLIERSSSDFELIRS